MVAYNLKTKSGINAVVDAPVGATKKEVIDIYNKTLQRKLDAPRLQQEATTQRARDARSRMLMERKRAYDPTITDYLAEIPKGVVGGAANLIESGALGIAALLPEEAENVVRDGIKSVGGAVQDYVKPTVNTEDSVPRKFSEAVGSFAGLAGVFAANPIAGITTAVGAGVGEASERARAADATQEERNLAATLGILPGALELIPISRFVKGVKLLRKGEAATDVDSVTAVGPNTVVTQNRLIANRVARAAREGGIEGAQETASSIAQNMIEQGYNPDKGTFEGSGEAAGYGFGVGAFAQTLLDLAAPKIRGSADVDGEEGQAAARAAIGKSLDETGAVDFNILRTLDAPALTIEKIINEEKTKRNIVDQDPDVLQELLTKPRVVQDKTRFDQAVAKGKYQGNLRDNYERYRATNPLTAMSFKEYVESGMGTSSLEDMELADRTSADIKSKLDRVATDRATELLSDLGMQQQTSARIDRQLKAIDPERDGRFDRAVATAGSDVARGLASLRPEAQMDLATDPKRTAEERAQSELFPEQVREGALGQAQLENLERRKEGPISEQPKATDELDPYRSDLLSFLPDGLEGARRRKADQQETDLAERSDAQTALKQISAQETADAKQVTDRLAETDATRTKILQDTIANAGELRRPEALRKAYEDALTAAGITNAKATPQEVTSLKRASDAIRAKSPVPNVDNIIVPPALEPVTDPRQADMEAQVAPKPVTPTQASFAGMGRSAKLGTPPMRPGQDTFATAEPTVEPRIINEKFLDNLKIRPQAAVRKRTMGKDFNDPVVRADIASYAGLKSTSLEAKNQINRLLDDTDIKQTSIFDKEEPTKKGAKPDADPDKSKSPDAEGSGDGDAGADGKRRSEGQAKADRGPERTETSDGEGVGPAGKGASEPRDGDADSDSALAKANAKLKKAQQAKAKREAAARAAEIARKRQKEQDEKLENLRREASKQRKKDRDAEKQAAAQAKFKADIANAKKKFDKEQADAKAAMEAKSVSTLADKPKPAGETGARTTGFGGGATDPERRISRRNLKEFTPNSRPAPTEPSAKKITTLWNESASDAKQEDYKNDDAVRNSTNPFNDEDNNTIYELLTKKLTGNETNRGGNDSLVNVVAYLSRYPNPMDGIKLAAYDLVNNTEAMNVNVQNASVAYIRTAEMYKDMGGVPSKKGKDSKGREITSPAERLQIWVNTNLSRDGRERFNKEVTRATTAKLSQRDSYVGISNIREHIDENVRQAKVLQVLQAVSQRDKFKPADLVAENIVTKKELNALLKNKSLEQIAGGSWVYNPPSLAFKGQEFGKNEAEINEDRRTTEEYLKDLGVTLSSPLNLSLEAAYVVSTASVHPSVTNALKNNNLQDALLFVSQTSSNKQVRQLAEKFAKVTGTTKVVIKKNLKLNGRPVAGLFEPRTNTITLDADAGINLHTLMHEMSHAAGSAAIADKSSQLAIKLNELFKRVRGSLSRESGTANLQEFFAEAMANSEFRSELSAINMKGEPVTALQRFFNIMQNFLRKFTGAPSVNLTALQQVDSLTDALLAPAPDSRNSAAYPMAMMDTTRKGVQNFMSGFIDGTQKVVSKTSQETIKNNTKDFFTQTIDKKGKDLLMMLSGSQAMGDIASAVGLGNLGYDLDRIMAQQRGSIMNAEAKVKDQIEDILTVLNKGNNAEAIRKRIEALNTVIYDNNFGATIFQVDPNEARSEYLTKKGESKIDNEGNKLADIWDAQRKHWNDMGPEGQKAFNDMRKVYDEQYASMKEVLFKQVDDSLGDGETAKALKNTITKQLFDKSKLKVYFPLLREGDFVLRYDVKNIDPKKRIANVLQTFETASERDDAKAVIEASSDYENVTTSDGELTLSQMQSVPAVFVQDTLSVLKKAKVDASVQKDILQLFIKTLPETSFAKALQGRKGTPGYMQDSVLALKTKAYNIASQAQKIKYGAEIRALELKIENAKPPTDPPAKGKTISGKVLRGLENRTLADFDAVKAELYKRSRFAREGATNPTIEAVGRRLNQAAFIYTIGFNASSAMVNLSQIPLFVAPYLGGQYGYKKTHAAIKSAYGNVIKSKTRNGAFNSLYEYYKRDDNGALQLRDRSELNLPDGAEGDAKYLELGRMTALVEEARGRGLLQSSALAESMGLTEYSRIAKGGAVGRALDNTAVLSAILFNHGEQMNRQVTLMASFNLALDAATKGKPETATADQIDTAVQDAIYNTQQTNGGTFLESAPRITQEGIGRVAGMYKSYGMQMYYTMMKTAKIAFDGDKGALFGKDGVERRTAWKQLIGLHGTAMLFAGVQGLPLYGAVRLITNLFFLDDEEDDFDTIVRKHIGEGWYKGGITAATGLDVSTRVALTGLLLQQNRYNNDPSIEEQLGFYFGGPALSVAKRLDRGKDDIINGEFERGIENLLPAGISNAYKNTFGRYQQEGGVFTRRQDPIYDDISAGEQFFWALGISPAEYTLRQDKAMIGKRVDTAVNKKRSELLKKYYVASRMYDTGEMLRISTKMMEFSLRHPDAAIGRDTIERSMKTHATSSETMYNGVSFSSLYGDTIRMMLSEFEQ